MELLLCVLSVSLLRFNYERNKPGGAVNEGGIRKDYTRPLMSRANPGLDSKIYRFIT